MILEERDWHARRAAHEARVRPWIAPRLERMARHESHPVEDFLFEYYPYRAGQLARWHPGLGVALAGRSAREYLPLTGYREIEGGVAAAIPPGRLDFVRWLRGFLAAMAARPPAFGCFGLHEWAMVYKAEQVRHSGWPLRLSAGEISRTVEGMPLRCSHYDAFRFFTPAARPLNRLQPERGRAVDFEQPGCLHAGMDLYKWAFKLAPLSPSELVADAFELAREIRQLDMRASPYDFRALGLDPVRVEIAEGREAYEAAQRDFAVRAVPLRIRLIALCDDILAPPPASCLQNIDARPETCGAL